MIFTTSSI